MAKRVAITQNSRITLRRTNSPILAVDVSSLHAGPKHALRRSSSRAACRSTPEADQKILPFLFGGSLLSSLVLDEWIVAKFQSLAGSSEMSHFSKLLG